MDRSKPLTLWQTTTLDDLRHFAHLSAGEAGFWYLAQPYSGRQEESYEKGLRALTFLLNHQVPTFAPIVHTHPLGAHIADNTHAFWLGADRPFMYAASGILILQAPGWELSVGVRMERAMFSSQEKPEVFLPDEFWEPDNGTV